MTLTVQRVTGHRTVEVVMRHYFRPGREDFRQTIMKAMPKMLAEGEKRSAHEQAREILERMTTETCQRDRTRLLQLLAPLPDQQRRVGDLQKGLQPQLAVCKVVI